MKEEGFVYDQELEFALIWASQQALPAATWLLLLSGDGQAQPETEQGLPEVKALRQRVAEIRLYLPLLLWPGAATCATTKSPCCQHIPAGLCPCLLHCHPARLGEPRLPFPAQSPSDKVVKPCQRRSLCPHQ